MRRWNAIAKAREADANSKFVDSLEAMTLAAAGQRAKAVEMLAAITRRAASEYISPVSIAYICTALGDADRGVRASGPRDSGPRSEYSGVEVESDFRWVCGTMRGITRC